MTAHDTIHQLNNRLAAVLGNIELALDALEFDHPARERLADALTGARQACAVAGELAGQVRALQADVRDLAQIDAGYEETIVRLMEAFDCPNPNAVVEHIQALFEQQQNTLAAVLVECNIARAELTSVRPRRCVPERADDDERIFVEDAAPPKGAQKGKGHG
jgi:signal transduction histidine kinase